ncbi:hypothetical protein [Chondromyces apiculatus]|uniref:Uncharacterized protein n=1 Tax=Chondromyces apiculatus DSM 436 TaxID=1192034 RepID=A0A017SU57_9BACT|nr:hypothetical protein [Chondromyces apiculatus]EYF00489.1 Hypothetical protein CAP_0523 [Chondromyces apiculatus DSM 436]
MSVAERCAAPDAAFRKAAFAEQQGWVDQELLQLRDLMDAP